MKNEITLPNGEVYKIGDEFRGKLDPSQFHSDDQASARVMCSLHNFTDENREANIVQHISEDETEITLVAGGTAARLLVEKFPMKFSKSDGALLPENNEN